MHFGYTIEFLSYYLEILFHSINCKEVICEVPLYNRIGLFQAWRADMLSTSEF